MSSRMPQTACRTRILAWVGTSVLGVQIAAVPPASAQQVDTTTATVGTAINAGTVTDLEDLEKAFAIGNLASARDRAAVILARAKTKVEGNPLYIPNPFDLSTGVIVVVWAGRDGAGPGVLRRMTMPAPSSHPYSLDLPGIRDGLPPYLFEVLLAPDRRARLVSQYTFTREGHPITAQLPTVVERVTSPLFGLFGSVGGLVRTPSMETAPREDPIFAVASRVGVPFSRASVKVKSVAQIPVTITEWTAEIRHLAEQLRFEAVPRSRWARVYAGRLADAAIAVAKTPACASAAATSDDCLALFGDEFDKTYRECLPQSEPSSPSALPCVAGETPAKGDLEAMATVDEAVRKFVGAGGPVRIERGAEFKNRPRTHTSLGIGTAIIALGALNRERAKVNDAGNLVADPLGRQLSMVMVNWSPRGYDADAPSIHGGERWKFFGAGIVTPDPGIGIGGSALLVRGVGLTGGIGLLFTRGLGDEDQLGEAPRNARDPLDIALARVAFLGVSYTFK